VSDETAPASGGLFWPGFTILLVSAASMALEIVAGRALAPYVGMSLYTWTLIIAVVLAGLSLGNWIGGLLADRARRPEWLVAVGLIAASATTLICLFLLRTIAPAVGDMAGGGGPIAQIAILAMAAFFAPSVFAGLLSPLLTIIALNATETARRGAVLGRMFALGALGAILGTLGAGLVLISWLGTGLSVALIAAIYALLSVKYWISWAGRGVGAALVALAGLGAASPDALALTSPCDEESRYFCIRIDDIGAAGRPMRVMALDHLAHGVNDQTDPRFLWSPYVQGVDELIAARFPGPALSAFFIGGGAYTLPRAWAARYPEGRFTVAEVDPAVTQAAKDHMWFTPDARTTILHGDARRIMQKSLPEQPFDVIFGDAFHDIAIPQHLVTDEFHRQVAARLAPDGVYVLNVVDGLREPRFLLSLATTLPAQFLAVELWLDIESIRPGDARATWIVLASNRATGADRLTAAAGPRRNWARVPLDQMVSVVGRDQLAFLTDDYAPVDRLLRGVPQE